jgi:hypothetical protein
MVSTGVGSSIQLAVGTPIPITKSPVKPL